MRDPVSGKLEYMAKEFVVDGNMKATIDDLEQWTLLLGLDQTEFTALMGARALGKLPGGLGQRTSTPTMLNSDYFNNLVRKNWVKTADGKAYQAENMMDLTILRDDILLIAAAPYLSVVQNYAGDEDLYLSTLAAAWTKMMNADRFDGPTRNFCDQTFLVVEEIASESKSLVRSISLIAVALVVGMLLVLFAFGFMSLISRHALLKPRSELRQPLTTAGSSSITV